MSFVGRADLLGQLHELAAEAERGRGGAACLVGPPGIGKSRLSRAFVESLERVVVCTGRCAPPPASSLRPLSEIAVAAIGAGADLERVEDSVFGAGVRALLGDRLDPGGDRHALLIGEGLRRLLTTLAAPVVCIVEDLHWADDETLAALDYLVDHLDDMRLSLVINTRAHEGPDADRVIAEWERRGVVRCVHVPPLGRDEVEALVATLIGSNADDDAVSAIAEASEGTPLLVEEFAHAASVESGETMTIPASYRDAVERRFRALGANERRTVALAALVGRDVQPQRLASFGATTDEVTVAVAAALRAQLIDLADADTPTRFHHALTRDAIVDVLDDAERTSLATEALAGVSIAALDADGLDAAAQLAHAAGDDRRAAELLLEAARRAVGAGATATALRRLDVAEALRDADAVWGPEIREMRVQALALSGRSTEASELAERLLTELDPDIDAERVRRLILGLARADGASAEWVSAARRLDDAFGDRVDGGGGAPEVRSFRAVVAVELGDLETAERLAQAVLATPDGGGVPECEAREVLGRVARENSYAEAAVHFRAGVDAAGSAGLGLWRARSLLELGLCEATLHGRVDTLAEASRSARRIGALTLSVMCDYNQANLHGIQMRPAEALAAADRAIAYAQQADAPVFEALGWLTTGQAHASGGAAGKAKYAGDRARAVAPDNAEIDGMAMGMCAGWSHAVVGELDEAADHYARSIEVLDALPYPTATAPWYGGSVVLAAVDHPLVDRVRDRLRTPAFTGVPGLEIVAGVVEMIVAGRRDGPEAADQARRALDDSLSRHAELVVSVEPFLAVSRAIAAVAARDDSWGDPGAEFAYAEEVCRLRGLRASAQWLASELRAVGAPPRTRGRSQTEIPDDLAIYGLTNREFDVLVLLRERLTNREIAGRLTVSPSTVKTHVERLLAKTGRANRGELADLAAAVLD